MTRHLTRITVFLNESTHGSLLRAGDDLLSDLSTGLGRGKSDRLLGELPARVEHAQHFRIFAVLMEGHDIGRHYPFPRPFHGRRWVPAHVGAVELSQAIANRQHVADRVG